ncbi:MAG: L-idonate 5-dehydrogenase [Candidatus Limnocylindrales bacterium]|jgi:L-idonate 5-dehydrogenase
MRALVIHGVHDLRVDERDAPAPGPGEVEVSIAVGGICGSDLHYYHDGGVGDFKLREPMTLGHEVVGRVGRMGAGVTGLEQGQRVAVHPARPCGVCEFCRSGRANICTDVRFLGSAGRFPHVQGGFSEKLVVSAAQIVPIPDSLSFEHAVFAEPLAVGIHAVHRAGDVAGRSVLITGAGPIGAAAILAAQHAGAARIIVTDIVDETLAVARRLGATDTINVRDNPGPLPGVDFAIEMSGAAAGVASCLNAVRRGGRVVLVGMPATPAPAPLFLVVSREIEVVGSYRYTSEYAEAVGAIAAGLDVTPLMSGRYTLDHAEEAFALASDRKRAMKVQLEFEPM